jgi:hypothetical protein
MIAIGATIAARLLACGARTALLAGSLALVLEGVYLLGRFAAHG